MSNADNRPLKTWDELRSLYGVARSAWKLVPFKHRLSLGGASAIMALTSAGNIAVAVLLGVLVDRVGRQVKEGEQSSLLQIAGTVFLGLAVIYIVREALNVVRRIMVEKSCTEINCNMQTQVIKRVMQFDLQLLGLEKIGTMHGKIFRSIDGLIHFVRLMFLDCLPALLTGLFALCAAVYKQPAVGAIMLGVVPLSFWLTIRQLSSQKSVRLDLMRDCEKIDGIVVEQLGGVEYIRVANTLDAESERLRVALESRRQRELKHHIQMALFGSGKALNEGVFHIAVLGLATYMAIHEYISVGDVLTFSVLFLNVMAPLNEVHRVIDEGHESSLRLADLVELLETPLDPSYQYIEVPHNYNQKERPYIEFENVHVSYKASNGSIRPALSGVSLAIHQGETIGIAGHSGSGKSTWVKLLLRLLHPTEGTIYFQGKNLAAMTREELAWHMGYVGQNPFVISGTIAENIAYGCRDHSQEDIERAAEMANLHQDVLELLGGYESIISERGNNLSGGQRQRLALARVILKQPPVLVLDEATSALDNLSERRIQSALGLDAGNRTTILLAHRLSTLRDCDRIFVFEHGQLAEDGTYEELVESNGIFASLVHSAESSVSAPVV